MARRRREEALPVEVPWVEGAPQAARVEVVPVGAQVVALLTPEPPSTPASQAGAQPAGVLEVEVREVETLEAAAF